MNWVARYRSFDPGQSSADLAEDKSLERLMILRAWKRTIEEAAARAACRARLEASLMTHTNIHGMMDRKVK
jgi:hypothetical protein